MTDSGSGREMTAGLAIGLGSIAMVLLMAWHPTTSAHDLPRALAEITDEAATTRFVHGGLIAAMWIVFLGLLEFIGRLGRDSARVRSGSVVYGAGMIATTGAALISGFLVPDLASRYVDATSGDLPGVGTALRLCFGANQTCAVAGVLAFSAGILLWSTAIPWSTRSGRALVLLGVLVATLPAIGLATGHLKLHLHGMAMVVVAQALWNIGVAVTLLLGVAPVARGRG